MAKIVFDTYGKTRVRLTYVNRSGTRHELKELTVNVLMEGAFEDAFTKADNSIVLPTDTMKNTVYALARKKPIESIEEFARTLARHFLAVDLVKHQFQTNMAHLKQVKIEINEVPWLRIGDSAAAFVLAGLERRTVVLTATRTGETFVSGITDLQILKTADSAFVGFIKDEYTTLAETNDRLLGTVLRVDWLYEPKEIDFNHAHAGIRNLLLSTFAEHKSLSVQQTLYDMAEAVLAKFDCVAEIHLVMPNKHCLLVDLSRFSMDNPNQVFQPTDEPSGYIEARIAR
jgi:urate oxidase